MKTKTSAKREKFLKEVVIPEYLDLKTPLYKLGKKYKCCPKVLSKYLKEIGVELETRVSKK